MENYLMFNGVKYSLVEVVEPVAEATEVPAEEVTEPVQPEAPVEGGAV